MEYLISNRRDRPANDPIFALNAEASGRAAAGEDVVNATLGTLLDDDGSLALLPAVVAALREVDPAAGAAYAPIAGRKDFLDVVARDLLTEAGLVDEAALVATPGATGALRLAIDNFLEPDQSLLTTSFHWAPYRTLAVEGGRDLVTFRMFGDDGRLDVRDLERKVQHLIATQGRVLLFLNTPCHNPSGYSIDQAEWDAIVEVIAEHGRRAPITVVLDVAYASYAAPAFHAALANVRRLREHAAVALAWSASKSFLQYGLRTGALVCVTEDADERRRIQNALSYSCRGTWSNCNALGMAAIALVLADEERRARVVAERERVVGLLASRVRRWNELAVAARLPFPRYDGGFFTTVFHPDSASLAASLREDGVFVVPIPGAVRIALCSVSEANVPRIVASLAGRM